MADKMKTMVTVKGAVVIRDGKRVRPQLNKAFDFTADEIETLNKATPGTLREPVESETTAAEPAKATNTRKAASGDAEAAQAGAKGGKKQATANKAESDTTDEDEEL